MSLTHERHEVVDFTMPTYFVEYAHVCSKPQRLDPFKNVVSPFSVLVWASIVGECIFIFEKMLAVKKLGLVLESRLVMKVQAWRVLPGYASKTQS